MSSFPNSSESPGGSGVKIHADLDIEAAILVLEDNSMKFSNLTAVVLIAVVLASCAAMAQSAVDTKGYPEGAYSVSTTNTVPTRIIVCPEWAADTWAKGVMDNNIHGRPDLAPTAPANRAEAWAFGVAAAKQVWRDNMWWIIAIVIGLTFGLITGLIGLALIRRELNALRTQPLRLPAFNLTLSLPNGLWSGPLVSGIRGGDTMVEATASPDILVEGGKSEAMGGTSNLASGEGSIAGRLQESTTIDCRESTGPFSTTVEAPEVKIPETSTEDKTLYYYRPLGLEFSEVISRVLDPDGNPDAERPEGWTLTLIRLETRLVNMYPMEVPVAYYGKPVSSDPISETLDTETNELRQDKAPDNKV